MREMFCFVECKDQIEEDMLNESFLEVINIRPKKKDFFDCNRIFEVRLGHFFFFFITCLSFIFV